jgi:hypothetical protein
MHYHSFILGQRSYAHTCARAHLCLPVPTTRTVVLTSACSLAHVSVLSAPPRVPISRSDKQSNRMLCHVQLLAEFSRL